MNISKNGELLQNNSLPQRHGAHREKNFVNLVSQWGIILSHKDTEDTEKKLRGLSVSVGNNLSHQDIEKNLRELSVSVGNYSLPPRHREQTS